MLDQGRHRRATIALGVGAVLMLGGCAGSTDEGGVEGPSALAASVGGEEITVAEVQTTSRELTEYSAAQAESSGQQAQEIKPQSMISSLVQVPAILEYAEEQGMQIPSAASVEQDLAQVLPSPSEQIVQFFRASAVYSQLDQKAQGEVAKKIEQADVSFSPRYDEAAGKTPNWIKESEPTMEMPGQ